MQILSGDTTPLRVWRNAPATPIGVPLNVDDDTTGKPLTSAVLTTLTGKLAILPAGSSPTGATDAAFVAFRWVKWADDLGEPIDVAAINVGPSGDIGWPATVTAVTVWWQLTDGTKIMAGLAPGSIELYG